MMPVAGNMFMLQNLIEQRRAMRQPGIPVLVSGSGFRDGHMNTNMNMMVMISDSVLQDSHMQQPPPPSTAVTSLDATLFGASHGQPPPPMPLPTPIMATIDANLSKPTTETEGSNLVPVLQNVVSTLSVGCKLDLKAIALRARNAEYNPKRFSAVVMRMKEPRTTALIFASGKVVCTGAKSLDQSKVAARKYARVIQKLGFPAKFKDFKIQNIVGSVDVKFTIRLEGLAVSHGAFARYDPEIFPGLVYRMKQPKVVILIFVSGKVVLTGAKVMDELHSAFEDIYPVLAEYKRN